MVWLESHLCEPQRLQLQVNPVRSHDSEPLTALMTQPRFANPKVHQIKQVVTLDEPANPFLSL